MSQMIPWVTSMTADSLDVWTQIAEAFPPVLPRQPVTLCDCDECRDVQANLGNLRWNEVLPPALDKHFGSLPLLTDDAFQALLPAYLFRALDDLSEKNKILEWTLYTLCPLSEEDEAATRESDAKLRKRIPKFTDQQRSAVRAFLALASAASDLDGHHQAITRAISAVWL